MSFCAKIQIKNDEIVRYKTQLVAQGCSQNFVLICEKTYSLVLDTTTLQYSIILVAQQGLHLHLKRIIFIWKSLKDFICPTRQILKRVIQ